MYDFNKFKKTIPVSSEFSLKCNKILINNGYIGTGIGNHINK